MNANNRLAKLGEGMVVLIVFFFAQSVSAFYCPESGRWLKRDPILETGGINLYAYIDNRVPNGTDPFGLAETDGGCPPFPRGKGDNCYQYACGKTGRNSDIVGATGGQRCPNPQDCDAIKKSAMHDGLAEVPADGNCPAGTHKVGFAAGTGSTQDYHWLRESNDRKTWCHKFRGAAPSNLDGSGKPITDPSNANLNFGGDQGHQPESFKFCGFLCAPNGK
jgi:hypothetical protein